MTRPPNYPHHLERTVRAQGIEVDVRPIVPDDAEQLRDEFFAADAETLRMRFFVPRPALSDRDFERLATVDYRRRLAITAWRQGEPVAIARYEPAGPTTAELAFAVKPEHRRLGIATLLTRMLLGEARRCGYDTVEAHYLADNAGARRVLQLTGFELGAIESGVVRATLAL